MKSGLYATKFAVPGEGGSGVAYFADGQIRGGDDQMFYVGTYTENGDEITASLDVEMHNKLPGRGSVFGDDAFTLSLSGKFVGDQGHFKATRKDAPNQVLTGTLRFLKP